MSLVAQPKQLKRLIIKHLKLLKRADKKYVYNIGWVKLLYCTAYHETDLSRRLQKPTGAARGVYQINWDTHRDIYTQHLFFKDYHNDKVIGLLDKLSYSTKGSTQLSSYRTSKGKNHSISILSRKDKDATFKLEKRDGKNWSPDYFMHVNGSIIGDDKDNPHNERIKLTDVNQRLLHALQNYDGYATCIARINYHRNRNRGGSLGNVTAKISDQQMANHWAYRHKITGDPALFLKSLEEAKSKKGHFPF